VQREIQRIVQVVIEVRAGADHEIDEAAIHQLDDAAAEAGGRQRAGDGEADRRIVLGVEHLVGEDAARLADPGRVEGLEPLVNQMFDVSAAARPVVTDWLAFEVLLA
jgi:hypothetical protein